MWKEQPCMAASDRPLLKELMSGLGPKQRTSFLATLRAVLPASGAVDGILASLARQSQPCTNTPAVNAGYSSLAVIRAHLKFGQMLVESIDEATVTHFWL